MFLEQVFESAQIVGMLGPDDADRVAPERAEIVADADEESSRVDRDRRAERLRIRGSSSWLDDHSG